MIRAAKLAYWLHQAINGDEQGRCEGSRRVATDMQSTSGPLKHLHFSPRWSARPH